MSLINEVALSVECRACNKDNLESDPSHFPAHRLESWRCHMQGLTEYGHSNGGSPPLIRLTA
jgi:hypothetical protein